MKNNTFIVALSAVLLLILAVSGAWAQGTSSPRTQHRQGVIDANGDGICDVTGRKIGSGTANRQGQQAGTSRQNGPGDGTGNMGSGPKDGTGYGAQSGKRLGPQDGSPARIGQASRPGFGGSGKGAMIRKGGKR